MGAKADFQEAVRAWREGRNAEKIQPEVPATPSKFAPGAFWSSLGENEVNLGRCSTPLTLQSQTQPANPSDKRISCYHCYKQFYSNYAVERCSPMPDHTIRKLCSEDCANA